KASRWRGSGAAALGLRGHVEPGEFRRVLKGHVPGTDIRLGRLRDGEHEHRPGLDITLSAPKSVSLEALLGGPGSTRAMRAHDAAVRATLDFIEARLLRTRRWSREQRRSVQVSAPMLVAAAFRHITSRNNDPQLHTHCVIANMTRDGAQWRSAEIGLLRRSEKLIGAFYRNELAHRLRKAGFALRPSMIGRVPGFEISGWPRAALEAFSSRRRQILDFIREKGWRYDARTAQAATLATRARKNEPRRAELEALWQAFAEERGIRKLPRRNVGQRNPEPPTAVEIAWRVLEQLEERASVFPARDALALALAHSPGLYRLEEIEGAFAALEREGELLPAIRRGVGQAWTTARAAHAEREVLERMRAGIGSVRPLAAGPVPDGALAGLNRGQREAAGLMLGSRDRVVGVQGHAGAGKTTMLRRAVSCLGERRVLGLAPSSSAARTLSRETGLACRTLQWFLAQCRDVSDGVADAGTLRRLRERYRGAVVVVDEMSLVGTAQARALLRIAERLEVARLVLVGDSRQLRGVEAGQPFRQLQQAGMAVAEMDELRRQRDPDLKAAVQDMIDGDPGEALERLGSNLQELPPEEIAGMAAALWLRLSPEARTGTALLVPTRALRAEVEEAVREGLEAEGALRGGAMELETLVPLGLTRAETGDVRNWREGDIALFNREMKHYRVRKDDACTVMEVEEDRVRLAHADGRPRHLKPGTYLRYRLDLFEEKTLRIREGEQLRWTRNDRERGLANGDRAEVLEIGDKALLIRLADGREMRFARDDPQLRHLAWAYASTVHAAQGQTHDRVIAVLDSGAGPLVNQQTLYVQLSRAREQAVVLTDNREQLVETLEANTGERLTALEAIGETVTDRTVTDRTVADRAVADRAPAARIPAKSAVRAETAAAFLEARRAERESEAARIAREAQARRTASWTGAAERALASRPSPEDGHAQEAWRLGLEALVAEGRTAVREALDAGAAGDALAARVGDLQERLESVLAEEEARVAAARAEPWLAAWRAAADPGDPFRAVSPDARIADGRAIAADPALPEELRRAVAGIVDGHDARAAALRAAEPWLRSWERFEGSFQDRAATLEAPEAAGRIGRGRALLDDPGLPEPVRNRIAAIVDDHDDRLAERERERERQRQEAEARAEERARETALEAARAQARHAARALEEAGAVRRKLASGPAAGTGIGAATDRLAALAGDRDRLAPDLSAAEARRLDEAVGEAAGVLKTRIAQAQRSLEAASDDFGRVRAAFNCDAVRAGWEEHIASEAFRPLDAGSHREWIDLARDMAADPRLDPGRRSGLVELLRDYDTVWPTERARYSKVVQRWNAMVATARKRGVSTSDIHGFEALFEEVRGLTALAPLAKDERDRLHAIIRKRQEYEKMTLTRSLGLGL
ncbi:MAG: relaxase domain-containing protein, partial [Alphaproteobacteria bacterium]|nr:relaxase domain-containing protein [Alphaproteobacteria bacterium]